MKKNKKVNSADNNEKNNFFEKIRTDKKYSAKIQLLGYGLLIFLVILFLNINSMGNSSYNSVTNSEVDDEEVLEAENISLLEKISNNYEYDINIDLVKTTKEEIEYHYYGKSYENNLIINKEFNGNKSIYYNVDGYYYINNENNEYGLIKDELVYDLVDGQYIELDEVLKLIKKASLEHVEDSTSGAKESVYNLLVRDLVISNKSDDLIVDRVIEEDEKLSINIDYTKLMQILKEDVDKCEVEYVYTNIDKVEKFEIMDENKNTE